MTKLYPVTPPGEATVMIEANSPEEAHAAIQQMKAFPVTRPGEDPVTIRGTDPEDAYKRLQASQQDFSWGSAGKEAGAAGIRGLGIIGGAGGSLRDMGQSGAKWAIKKLTGHDIEPGGTLDTIMKYSSGPLKDLPNISEAQAALSKMTGGYSERQPHNTGEEFIRTPMEFAPAAVIAALTGGVEAMPAAFDLAASSLSSESLGQFARKYLPDIRENEYVKKYGPENMPSTEDIARFIGGLGGSVGASKAISPNKGTMTPQQFVDTAEKKVTGKPIGQNAAPPKDLEQALNHYRGEFQRLTSAHDMGFDSTFRKDAVDIFNGYHGSVGVNKAPALKSLLTNLTADAQTGVITGQRFQNYIERMRRLAKSGPTSAEKEAAADMRTALNNAMERHLAANAPDDLGAFKTVRNGYRDSQTLIDAHAAAKGRPFTPDQLYTAAAQHAGKKSVVFGKNDLANLAQSTNVVPLTDVKIPGEGMINAASGATGIGVGNAFGGLTPEGYLAGTLAAGATKGGLHLGKAALEKLLNSPTGKAYRFNQIVPADAGGLLHMMAMSAPASQHFRKGGDR